jgi:stage V sporulation protein B
VVLKEKKEDKDITGEGVIKGSIYIIIGQGVAGIFLFLFQTLTGRWLGVKYYGIINILYSAIIISNVFITDGVSHGLAKYISLFQAKNLKKKIEDTIQISFLIYLILILTFLLVAIIFRKKILNNFFNNMELIYFHFILGVLSLSLYSFYNGLLRGYRRFRTFSIGFTINSISMLIILLLVIPYLKLQKIHAGWSFVISPIIPIIFFKLAIKNKITFPDLKKPCKLNPDIVKFTLMSCLIAVLTTWIVRSGPILLKIVGDGNSDSLAGLFSAVMMPLNLLRTVIISFLGALFPNLTRAYSLNDENLIRRYVYKSLGIVMLITASVILFYYFLGPQIIRLLYGEEFSVSRSIAFILSIAMSFLLLGTLLSRILMARDTTYFAVISLVLGIAGMIVFLYWGNLEPMKLVITSLLICNIIYFGAQALYLTIIIVKRLKKSL